MGHLCRNILATSRYIQEGETSFDPHVTLFTWEEWIEDYQDSSRRDQRWRAHESTVTLLNRRRDEREPLEAISMRHELLVGQPYYDYDPNTGARRNADQCVAQCTNRILGMYSSTCYANVAEAGHYDLH